MTFWPALAVSVICGIIAWQVTVAIGVPEIIATTIHLFTTLAIFSSLWDDA